MAFENLSGPYKEAGERIMEQVKLQKSAKMDKEAFGWGNIGGGIFTVASLIALALAGTGFLAGYGTGYVTSPSVADKDKIRNRMERMQLERTRKSMEGHRRRQEERQAMLEASAQQDTRGDREIRL